MDAQEKAHRELVRAVKWKSKQDVLEAVRASEQHLGEVRDDFDRPDPDQREEEEA